MGALFEKSMGLELRLTEKEKALLELEIERLELLAPEDPDNKIKIIEKKEELLKREKRRLEIMKVLNLNGRERPEQGRERQREGILEKDHGISLS